MSRCGKYNSYHSRKVTEMIIEIQNIVLKGKQLGRTQKHIYEHDIFPVYKISYSSFNRYLSINAKKELTKYTVK